MATTYFSLSLGAFDSDEAISTLAGQLELLRNLRDLRRPDVALIYRMQSEQEPEGDLVAYFKLLCVGRSPGALSESEVASLLDQVSVTLIRGWGLSHTDDRALPVAKHRARLRPLDPEARLPIRPDWAPLVDLLRRRSSPMTIDLACSVDEGASPHSDPAMCPPYSITSDSQERKAAEFFAAVALINSGAADAPPLALHLSVHSEEPIDDIVARAIGRFAFGLPIEQVRVRKNITFPRNLTGVGLRGKPEEIIRAFHPPYGHIEGRGLAGGRPLRAPIRFRVKEHDGTSIGNAVQQGARGDASIALRLADGDRLKHTYVLGKTGSGKTTFLKNLVRQDIAQGTGVAVIDPHGDLIDYALRHVGERLEEVVLLDFSDPTHLPTLNPLLIDVGSPADEEQAVEELLDILIRRSFNEFTGPVFEDTVRMLLATVNSERLKRLGIAPSIIAAVELFRARHAREWVANELAATDPLLAQEWRTFNAMLPHNIAEHVRWVLAKFAEFNPESVLYSVTGGTATHLSFNEIFAKRQILLVKIPESVIGGRAASFIGALVFARLHRAALKASPTASSRPFHLHVDEFQKFVSADIEGLVAEARKFNLSLTLAHQNLRQLDAFSRYEGTISGRLREAIFSNVGTIVCMKMSGSDVHTISGEFGVDEPSLRRIAQYDALVRAVVNGSEHQPFSLTVPDAERIEGEPGMPRRVRRLMLERAYWHRRDRLQEAATGSLDRMQEAWSPPDVPGMSPDRAVGDASNPDSSLSLRDQFMKDRDARHSDRGRRQRGKKTKGSPSAARRAEGRSPNNESN